MDVVILDNCEKEIKTFPKEILKDFLAIIEDLENGFRVGPPISKKLSGIGPGVFELRFKAIDGIYRIFYFLKKKDKIYFVHGFKKKAQKIPKKNIDLALKRIRRIK